MSDSYECDRCGTHYTEKNRLERNPVKTPFSLSYDSDVWDLCESCMNAFEAFIDEGAVSRIPFHRVKMEYKSVDTESYQPPNHPMDARCVDTVRINKNLFGDADRAEGALDDQIKGGHRNY